MNITCGVFFVAGVCGYEILDLESNETLTRYAGFKTVEDALYYGFLAANDIGNSKKE